MATSSSIMQHVTKLESFLYPYGSGRIHLDKNVCVYNIQEFCVCVNILGVIDLVDMLKYNICLLLTWYANGLVHIQYINIFDSE